MDDVRIERQYYPDGTLKQEVHYRGKKEHGPWREWHPNGVLAKEYWFEDGLYTNSVSRSWDEHGTLRGETTFVNGGQLGRQTVYNEDGSIMVRYYALEDGLVSRAGYDEACKSRPELPRYADPDPHVCRPQIPKLKRSKPAAVPNAPAPIDDHEREIVTKFLAGSNAEAREWLAGAVEGSHRTLGEMGMDLSSELVERLYLLGAAKVLAVEIVDIPGTDSQTTNCVLVQLPEDAAARGRLFEFESEHAGELGFDGETDRGQEYLFMLMC